MSVEGSAGFLVSGRNIANAIYRLENGAQAVYPMRVSTRQEGRPNIPVRFYYETNPVVEYRNPFAERPLNYADDWGASDIIAIADALASIHSAVAAKFAPAYGIAQARRDQELSIAIGHSASLDGGPVGLPLKEETVWERAAAREVPRPLGRRSVQGRGEVDRAKF